MKLTIRECSYVRRKKFVSYWKLLQFALNNIIYTVTLFYSILMSLPTNVVQTDVKDYLKFK